MFIFFCVGIFGPRESIITWERVLIGGEYGDLGGYPLLTWWKMDQKVLYGGTGKVKWCFLGVLGGDDTMAGG